MTSPARPAGGESARVASVREAVRATADRLRAAGVPSPEGDARRLVAHALGVPVGALPLQPAPDPDTLARLEALAARRAAREPLQHILGRAGFHRVELQVGPGAFVPRPETEVLVEHVLGAGLPTGALVVDLCTGPGTIALALAAARPDLRLHAVDVEPAALGWARRNAQALGAGDRVQLHEAGVRDVPSLLPSLAGTVDAVTANPPYLPASCAEALEPEVVLYDPPAALFGGRDGLDLVRDVIAVAAGLLRAGGLLALEHADTQRDAVLALLAAGGVWDDMMDHRDLAGRDRFATAVRTAGRRR